MTSNARIFTTDGHSSSGVKYFGLTVKDRQDTVTPNMTQVTVIPASGTIQNHRFILGASDTTSGFLTTDSALSVTPDLTLQSTRLYQFQAYLTVVLKMTTGPTYYTGHYLITSAARGTTLIGGGYGYRVDTISSETGIDSYIDETKITLTVSGNKFVVTVGPSTANVTASADILVDITINSSVFN
jgi:hypothetical protein